MSVQGCDESLKGRNLAQATCGKCGREIGRGFETQPGVLLMCVPIERHWSGLLASVGQKC